MYKIIRFFRETTAFANLFERYKLIKLEKKNVLITKNIQLNRKPSCKLQFISFCFPWGLDELFNDIYWLMTHVANTAVYNSMYTYIYHVAIINEVFVLTNLNMR